ncbi:MAG: extracellular catalytic domain type 1 short-chain-length polyhydroxyalkanoate depolymerase [Telluria sp.]
MGISHLAAEIRRWLRGLVGPRPGSFIDGSFANAAGQRGYKVYVPGRVRKPAALVVMLHGCTQHPEDFARGTRMNKLADEHGFVVAYPAQSEQANPQRCWNWFSALDQQHGKGEPSIIAGITQEVVARYGIDPRAVYVAGMSAGGAMAVIMGTQYPELYAAVGVHSGLPFAAADDLPSALAAMRGEYARPRPAGTPLPVIVFHGDEDRLVHPLNAREVIAQTAHAALAGVEAKGEGGGLAFTRTTHRRADDMALAEHWLVHGLGHAWSGGDPAGSHTASGGPDASREMLRFFRTSARHSRAGGNR